MQQKFTGRNELVERLAFQVGSKELAEKLLIKRGQMTPGGVLTHEGRMRNQMTAEERAKDRAAMANGGTPKDYVYDMGKNTARKR